MNWPDTTLQPAEVSGGSSWKPRVKSRSLSSEDASTEVTQEDKDRVPQVFGAKRKQKRDSLTPDRHPLSKSF